MWTACSARNMALVTWASLYETIYLSCQNWSWAPIKNHFLRKTVFFVPVVWEIAHVWSFSWMVGHQFTSHIYKLYQFIKLACCFVSDEVADNIFHWFIFVSWLRMTLLIVMIVTVFFFLLKLLTFTTDWWRSAAKCTIAFKCVPLILQCCKWYNLFWSLGGCVLNWSYCHV